jgi:hypothetical protein
VLHAQVTGTIVSFQETNYGVYVIAGDSTSGGRQAIRTSTVMFYTNSNPSVVATNIFQLAYQLLDAGGNPVAILDEKGNSNVTYSVYQTNISPVFFVTAYTQTNSAALQPLTRLNPYVNYSPQLKVYSSPFTNNPTLVYNGQSSTGTPESYFDFTNTVSPDVSPNLLVVLQNASLSRTWSISNSPGQYGFPVTTVLNVARYDDFNLPQSATNTTVTLNYQLINNANGLPVPLLSSQAVFNVSIESHDLSSPPNPVDIPLSTNFTIVPAVQLDSVDSNYQVVITISHTEGIVVVNDHTNSLPSTQLLAFNGQLFFGPLLTYFTNLDLAPNVTGITPGDHLDCLMNVTTNAGLLPGAPGYNYGNGTGVSVMLQTNGTAQIKSPAVVTVNNQPPVKNRSIQNISFQTAPQTLTSAGASEQVTLFLPAGFSVETGGASNHLFAGSISLGNISLDANLNFQSGILTLSGPFLAAAENLPCLFSASSMQWAVSAGTLSFSVSGGTFTRQTEDDLLTANQSALVDSSMAKRISNDGYFRNSSSTGSLIVSADANGLAQVSCQLSLNPPELRPHFPYSSSASGQAIHFSASGGSSGNFILSNNAVVPASYLSIQSPMPLSYARDTSDTNCNSSLAGPQVLEFSPTGNQIGFTADGGLLASGSVPTGNLTWGYVGGGNYAQEVQNINSCNYEMAGIFLPGNQAFVDQDKLAAELLFSGFGNGTNLTYVERPGESTYSTIGAANYPGLNFFSPTTETGSSYLAGTTQVTFPLAFDSKYYARFGGVSGIHDTLNFPSSTLQLYTYDFTFSSYRLSFLDSEPVESLTVGDISLPNPASFTQPFSHMQFSGRGYLESADVPPASPLEHMNYWNVDITPESIQFQPLKGDTCGTGQRFLVLGVEAQLAFIPQKLHASLGFKSSGNLVTVSDNVLGCDSRFAVPGQLKLQGPDKSSFILSTATEGYFNNYQTPGSPPFGFYNLAGKLRVPFFEDVRVHLHIAPSTPTTGGMTVMGGWPDPTTTVTNEGWNEGGENYFNTAKFDPSAAGFPQDEGVGITDYEKSQSLMYHPVAQRNWIQVAVFDYPLQWNPVLRKFAGYQDAPVSLPVINVNSRLKELTPGKVNFDFSQDVSLQLPVMKVLDLVNDAVGEIDGPLQSLTNAVQSALGTAFDSGGLNELQGLLREDSSAFMQPILNSTLSTAVNQLYTQFANYPQTDKQAFISNAVYQITNVNGPLNGAINNIVGAPGQAGSIVGQVNKTLGDAQADLSQFIKIISPDDSGNYHTISQVIQKLMQDDLPGGQYASALTGDLGSKVDSLVSGLAPTLNELQGEFQSLSNQFDQVHQSLTNATGEFSKALGETTSDTASVQEFAQLAAVNVSNLLSSSLTSAGDYFTANPAAAKQAIQQQLANAFQNSQLCSDYQSTIRQFLSDDNATLGELMDSTFDQVNNGIRDAIGNAVTSLDTNFISKDMSNLLYAKIRGAPTFNGDSLRKIHLNASVKIKIPTDMDFNAYLDIKELTSKSVAVSCIPEGPPAAEITLGAKKVKLDWASINDSGTPLTVSVAAKWTLQDNNVLGVGGMFDIKGEIGFQGCSVNEIGAMLSIGKEEIYFAAKVAGTINVLGVPVGIQGGVFVGKACTLQPLLFIDPQASDVLGNNHVQVFEGIYVVAGADISLSEILFGTSSCELDVGMTETAALYYEANLPSLTQFTVGMRQSTALDASVLCLVSANASLDMFNIYSGALDGNFGLTLGGVASICGSIGPCPFCISGCKSLRITGTVSTGGISYSISD